MTDRSVGVAARSGRGAAVVWAGRWGRVREHRRGGLSAPRRARSVGDDPRRERRQPALDPAARRAGVGRDALLPSLQRATGEELHGRLLGSARRRQVIPPWHPSIVDDRRAVHPRPRRAGRSCLQAAREDEGCDLRALLGSALGTLYAARFPDRLRPTSAAGSAATPPPAKAARTRTAWPRRSATVTAGR